jgi:hypothetical protein
MFDIAGSGISQTRLQKAGKQMADSNICEQHALRGV